MRKAGRRRKEAERRRNNLEGFGRSKEKGEEGLLPLGSPDPKYSSPRNI
jgi:hypothetical protein